MSYAAGQTILDDEYNIFATGNASGTGDASVANVNTIYSTGTGDKGYGQTATTTAVSAAGTVTAAQWEALVNTVEVIGAHTGTSVTATATITAGNTISAISTLSANLSSCFTNRGNAAAVGASVTTGGVATRSSVWYTSVTNIHTITFQSANAARYFFNAGGRLTLTFARSGGTTNNKNTEWADLCSQMGTLVLNGGTASIAGTNYTGITQIGGGAGGAGGSMASLNFNTLTTSDQRILLKYADTAPYTANYIDVNAKTATSGTQVVFTCLFTDAAADTGAPPFPAPGDPNPENYDKVDGTLTSTAIASEPSTTYLTNTWSLPTAITIASSSSGS